MNKNLKEALKLMLFLTDEQPLDEDFDKINFKKEGWFREFHWTEKNEEKAKVWLSNFLKKNWEGIAEHKPFNKYTRDEIAEQFIFNYAPMTRELKITDFTPTVSWAQLDEVMSKREQKEFNIWMIGQTTPLHGVYKSDLSRYLAHLPCID